MTSKERMLRALAREKPDRLPVTVHQWQRYHLDTYLGGASELEAFGMFGLDAAVTHAQDMGQYWQSPGEFRRHATPEWRDEAEVVGDAPDRRVVRHVITTPEGPLTYATEGDRMTTWVSDHLIKRDDDIRLIERYMPVPPLDRARAERAYDAVGDRGLLRGFVWGDQGGCWQHAACLLDVQTLILRTFDDPAWVHELLRILLEKKLRFIESMKGARFDIVETGGGAASSTLISPSIHRDFCLPYDRKLHDALHDAGFPVVYHTCGGTKGIEELIVELKKDVTIIQVTHNTGQAARISDVTAFVYLGELVEFDATEKMFTVPEDRRTEEYLTGKFG